MSTYCSLLIALALVQPTDAKTEAPSDAIIRLTNEFRKSEKVSDLKSSKKLNEIAQAHADNMARQDKYGDSDKNGHVLDDKKLVDRLKAAGYKYRAAGENVGCGRVLDNPIEAIMDGWKNSPSHRENLARAMFTEMGAGVAQGKSGRWYFVQVFGKPME